MKIIAINASPRKNGNTAQMLNAALAGAAAQGAETQLIHLYDYSYQGCKSCFYCKRKENAGRDLLCVQRDELRPVLEAVLDADGVILGAPIYFGNVPGMLTAFLERLVYPVSPYEAGVSSYYTGKKDFAIFYTMNQPESTVERAFARSFADRERLLARFGGTCVTCYATETQQFDDYSRYAASRYDPAARAARRETQFPVDLANANAIGARLARGELAPREA